MCNKQPPKLAKASSHRDAESVVRRIFAHNQLFHAAWNHEYQLRGKKQMIKEPVCFQYQLLLGDLEEFKQCLDKIVIQGKNFRHFAGFAHRTKRSHHHP